MAKRVTLTDIARETGLSAATVSMVLNNRPGSRISESTASRVRAAADALGYSPDVNARGLRTGRSNAVGFISDEVTITRFASAMIRGLLDVGGERDYVVMMAECKNGSSEVENAVKAMVSRRIDGLLFGQMTARRIEIPRSAESVPAVIINGIADGCQGVLPDEYPAGIEAVDYLVRAGHRRIALLGQREEKLAPEMSATIGVRMAGINEGMRRAGLEFQQSVPGVEWEPEFGYAAAMEALEDRSITALLVANDRVAMGAYQAAQTLGLSIPEDISIMSFDDEQLAEYLRPQVTTMRLPYLEMGKAGMDLLLQRLESEGEIREDGSREGESREGGSRTGGVDGGGDGIEGAREFAPVLIPMPLIERGSVQVIR
ncbi:MAG: LacI family DNA-binding transcriptional regulator [Ancrocorticia sp.]